MGMEDDKNNRGETSRAAWPRKAIGFTWLLCAGYLAYQYYSGAAGGNFALNVVAWMAIGGLVVYGIFALLYLKW